MATLNRFPLLALWASEAARRIGYDDRDSDTLGHAYAVLYAIRANSPLRPLAYRDEAAAKAAQEALDSPADIVELEFAGDKLHVSRNERGELVGRVGDQLPQTAESFRYKVARKFPPGQFDLLRAAFRDLLASYSPEQLDTRLVYSLYDQWKKACAVDRLVDLDRLAEWCRKRQSAAPTRPAS